MGWTIGPLLATIQRLSLTPSTWTTTAVSPHLGKVKNVGEAAEVKGRHRVVHRLWRQGNRKGDEREPEPEASFIKAHTISKTVTSCMYTVLVGSSKSAHRDLCADLSCKLHNTSRTLLQSSTGWTLHTSFSQLTPQCLCDETCMKHLCPHFHKWAHTNQHASHTHSLSDSFMRTSVSMMNRMFWTLNWRCCI
jgi:hypothetical protein